jgi:hypothetical protein
VSVLLISIAPYALAGKKKAAGECVGDSMYVDNKFGFSFVKPSDWKFQEVYKDKDIERVVIVQKALQSRRSLQVKRKAISPDPS